MKTSTKITKLSSQHESKLAPVLFSPQDNHADLRTLDTNITLNYLDEKIKQRETSVEKKIRRIS